MKADQTYSSADLCKAIGKPLLFVRNTEKALGIKHSREGSYSAGCVSFFKKISALRTVGIQQDKITELFELEKKILKLLHIDSLSDSETWYLDAGCAASERTLLLTGFDVGFSLGGCIQHGLDFGAPERELFAGHEMGEDIRLILERYVALRHSVRTQAKGEMSVIRAALTAVEKLFRNEGGAEQES